MRSTARLALLVTPLLGMLACETPAVSYIGPVTDQTFDNDTGATSDTGTGSGRACDERTNLGTCTTYTGAGWDAASIQNNCYGSVVDRCPGDSLGGCRFAPLQATEYVLWYYEGVYYSVADEPFLEADCLQGFGEWQ